MAAFALVATAFGAPSLAYPFGRDQGLYFYVAREWVARGAIPYRDVLDHKTPGIYVLHALLILVFGEHAWPIRLADLAAVMALGYTCARITTPRGETLPTGLFGFAWATASVLFFGYLNWWDTAQSELWYTTLGLSAVACALTVSRPRVAEVAAGALSGAAMIMKPPAIWLVLIASAIVARRTWGAREGRLGRLASSLALFGVGFAAPIIVMFAYFGAHHALFALRDIVVGANGYYVTHEKGAGDLEDVIGRTLDYLSIYNPFSTLGAFVLAWGISRGVRTKDTAVRDRYLLAALACLAGYAAVAMQQKFFLLHWGVMVGPGTLVFTAFAYDFMRGAERPARRAWITGVALMVAFVFSGRAVQGWFGAVKLALMPRARRAELISHYAFPDIGFSYADSEAAGLWIRDHSTPDDLVTVRGFEPEIYAIAERHHHGRFFWTTFLTSPVRAYRRAEWLAEDLRDLREHPPRFVVAKVIPPGPEANAYAPDTEAYFPDYERRATFGALIVLERKPRP